MALLLFNNFLCRVLAVPGKGLRIEAYNPGVKALPHRHLKVLSEIGRENETPENEVRSEF
ncbi:hypothetical protein DVH24_030047 [Malus domestica]|uniref:Uncharacterized protein n=1 Tax=Malus domestica TaxID=3750 RepID=A0A498HV42_MALDO|nr:hypothetical protein DVH24_030047 [Malus domestica]